jgi:hypothetical protein
MAAKADKIVADFKEKHGIKAPTAPVSNYKKTESLLDQILKERGWLTNDNQ